MTDLAPSIDDLVAHVLQADSYRQAPRKTWHRSRVRRDTSLLCTYCLRDLAPCDTSQVVLSYLVPVELGGPTNERNRLLSCRSCAKAKGTSDIISWGAYLSADVLSGFSDRRLHVLQQSANHLTNTRARAPAEQVLSCLMQRWQHPRFRVFAVQGQDTSWLAWTPRCGCASSRTMAMGLLRHRYQAKLQTVGKVSLLSMETPLFLEAVWELIELHAMVEHVDVTGISMPSELTDDWRTHWPTRLNTLGDLRRRRNFLTQRAPYQRQVSGHPDAIRKRRQRETRARIDATLAWRQARAELDDLKARVATGQAHDPSALEWLEMEREVLEHYELVVTAGGPLEPGSGARSAARPRRSSLHNGVHTVPAH